MKKPIVLCCAHLLFLGFSVKAQIIKPCEWDYKLSNQNNKVDGEVDLVFQVVIDETWQLYSHVQNYEIGPLPAYFEFEVNNSFELIGQMVPIGSKTKHEPVFDVNVNYFEGIAEFRQKVKVLLPNPTISGEVSYQVCSNVDGKCINSEEDFEFRIKTIE